MIAAAIAGIPVGHKLASALSFGGGEGNKAALDIFIRGLEAGETQLKNVIRAAEGTDNALTKNVIRAWVRSGEVSVEQAGVMIAALKDVNQKAAEFRQAQAERQGFGFARVLAEDGKLLKPEIKTIFNQLDAMPKKARDIAIKTMTDMARFLENSGKLPEGSTRKLVDAIRDKWGDLPGHAKKSGEQASNFLKKSFDDILHDGTKKSKQLSDGVSNNFASMNAAVNSGLKNIGENTNSALKAFGVKASHFSINDRPNDSVGGHHTDRPGCHRSRLRHRRQGPGDARAGRGRSQPQGGRGDGRRRPGELDQPGDPPVRQGRQGGRRNLGDVGDGGADQRVRAAPLSLSVGRRSPGLRQRGLAGGLLGLRLRRPPCGRAARRRADGLRLAGELGQAGHGTADRLRERGSHPAVAERQVCGHLRLQPRRRRGLDRGRAQRGLPGRVREADGGRRRGGRRDDGGGGGEDQARGH